MNVRETSETLTLISEFNLKKIIQSVISASDFYAKTKSNTLSLYYSSDAPRLIQANKFSIYTALVQLISNSIQFTNNGLINVYVDLITTKGNAATLQINVEDTGRGIDSRDIENIFENETLSSIQKIIANAGGEIGVNSCLGKGSVFWMSLPVYTVKQEALSISKPNILLIDDHIKRGSILLRHFRENTRTILCKSSQAIKTLKANPKFDIILIDDEIKSMDPLKLSESLLQLSPQAKPRLHILVSKSTYKMKALEAGYYKVLNKPMTVTEYIENIKQTWREFRQLKKAQNDVSSQAIRALIVEDNHLSQKVLQSMLEQCSVVSDIAEDGKSAVELCNKNDYDIVFFDVGLPDINGIDLAEHVRKTREHYFIPFIAYTAHADDSHKKSAFESGFCEFLQKPSSFSTIKDCLKHIDLSNRKSA